MLMNRELTFVEFKGFYECLDRKITEEEFKAQILTNFAASGKGVTLRGLKQFFIKSIQELGEVLYTNGITIRKWCGSGSRTWGTTGTCSAPGAGA